MTPQRRKEAYEALHPETKHGGDRRSESSRQVGAMKTDARFTADTAARTGQITEITLTGGEPGTGGPCFASAMNRTWHRAEGEGLATFQARVRAEALAIGADCILWTTGPTQEAP